MGLIGEEVSPTADFPKKMSGANGRQPPGENALSSLIAHISERGYEVFAKELTTPDVAQCGFCVVRVIIPGMQPLDNDNRYPHHGGRRMYEKPLEFGLRDEIISEESLNHLPHPFP